MPYLRLPDGSYADVPKGMSYEEALDTAKRSYPKLYGIEPTVGGQVKEFIRGVPAGLVSSLGQAARGIGALLPEEYETPFAQAVAKTTKALTPQAAPGYDETVGRKLGEAMGSVGSFLLPGGAAGVGARALGAGLGGVKAAQLATAGGLGSAAGAGEARTRAEQEGATPEQRRTATQFGAAIGLSEIAPVERFLGSLGKETVGGFIGYIKRALVSGGVEAGQEAASNVAQNLVAQKIYKPSQELVEGLGESAAYGAGAGALTQVLLDLALGRRAGPKPADLEAQRRAQEAQRQEQEAEEKRVAFEGLPQAGAMPGYGGTQTDIFGQTAGAYTPLQGTALPKQPPDTTPEISLQDEYRKTRAEADRLNQIVEAAKEQRNVSAYNAALRQLKKVDAAQSELAKTAKERGVILDVDSELKKAQAAVQRYMDKDSPVPAGLSQRLSVLEAEQERQAQQQAGITPGAQADLFNLPRQREEDAARAEQLAADMEAGYVGEQPPATLTPEPHFVAQQKLETEDRIRAQQEAQQQEKAAKEKLEKIEEQRMKGLPKTGKEPYVAQYGRVTPTTPDNKKAKSAEEAFFSKLESLSGNEPLNVSQLRLKQNLYSKRKESALYDMATIIDSLRKGDTKDVEINKNIAQFGLEEGQRRNALDAKNKVTDSLIEEVNAFRNQYNKPRLTEKEINEIEEKINKKFDLLIDRATPSAEQQPRVFVDAIEKAIAEKIKKVKKQATDPTKKAGVKELLKEINALRAKQNAIPKGVSFSKERAARVYGTIPEYTSWQRFLNELAFAYSPKPTTRYVVPGTAESFATATMRRPSAQTETEKETEKRGETKKTLAGELSKSREYALLKVKNILSMRTLDKKTKSVFQQVEDRLENGRGTGELLKEVYEATDHISIGQEADIASLQKALKTEEEAIQTVEQGELFVEKGREERAPAQMLTSVKRTTPTLFAKFADAIRKRTDAAVTAFINKQNLPEKISALEKDIAYLDKKVAELFGVRLDAAVNRLFNLAKKQTSLTPVDSSFKNKWEKLFASKKWASTNEIINARIKLQEEDFINKLNNLIKTVESSEANKIIKESKEWLEDKELFQQFFNESGFFDLKKWNKALKTELRLRSIGPQGLATQQVNADFARNLKALESAKEALEALKTSVNALTKSGVLKYSFGPHIGEFKQINNAALIQAIKTAQQRIEKNIELRRISNIEAQRRAAEQQNLQKAQEAVKKGAESVRTFETEFVPVKTAPKDTELGKIQTEIVEIQDKIFKLGSALGIEPKKKGSAKTKEANLRKAYLRVDIDPKLIQTSQQRSLNNQRLGLIEKRSDLIERMVMRRSKMTTQTMRFDVTEKPSTLEQAYNIASRTLPKKHAILTSQINEVRERLKGKNQTKARIKALEKRKDDLNAEIRKVEESAKKFSVNLAMRVFNPEDTAKAQQKAMRQMEAAERREGKKPPFALKIAKSPEEETSQQNEKRRGRLSLDQVAASFGITSAGDARAFEQAFNDERNTDWRDATDADSGVDIKAANDIAARVTKALPDNIKVVYAPTLKDAPPAFLGALYRSGKASAKGAVLPDGTVVVVGEAHKSTRDLEETFAHELIGHYGVDSVVGPERVKALADRLFKQGDAHVADVATALGVFPDVETALAAKNALKNPQVRLSIVREMIAHAAEGRRVAPTFTEKVKAFVRDMVAAVRSWFRSSGLSEMAKADAKEIKKLIDESSRSLAAGRLGVYVSPNGKVAFRGDEPNYPTGMSAQSRELTDALIYKQKGTVDKLKANMMGLAGMTQFVDRYAPVWAAMERGVAAKKMSDLEASQIRYNLSARDKLMNFTRLVASQGALEYKKKGSGANTYWMVETKASDPKDAATLLKVFEALKEAGLQEKATGNMFTVWLGAQRVKNEGVGLEKLNFAKDAAGNPIVTEAKLKQLEKEIDAMPKVKAAFEKARAIYNSYNKGLVDFAEQAGAISKEVADSLRAKKDYIPFYRPDPSGTGNVELVIGGETPIRVGNLRDQPYLHELVGGDTAISDIFTSAVQNTHLMTDMALRNIAAGSLADALRKLGMLDTRKYKDKETGKEKEAVRVSSELKGSDTLRFRKDGEDIAVRIAATKGTMFDGIDPALLVKGLEGVTVTMPAALELMGLPAKFLRRMVVLSPLYPIRQVIKDSFATVATSGANFIPVVDPFKNIYKAMTGTSREAQLLEKQGLLGGQLLASGGTKEGLSTVLRSVVSGKQSIASMLAWAESKSMEADMGVRLAAYNSFRKQGLNELETWVATNEIIDFNRRGVSPSVQWANTLYPFFSAQVQGLNVFFKALSGKMPYNERLRIQEKFIQRAAGMAAMTIVYAAAMEDDEAYANATPEQRLNNWFVRVPFADEPLKIPIPFELGLLAKAIPEAIYIALSDKEDFAPIAKALVGMGLNSIPGGSSKGIPQALLPAVEAYTGKDLFTGADVESAKMEALDPAERYKENTTELAKLLGSANIPGMSPVKIDQFIKGVGSQTLLAVASLGNVLLENAERPRPEKKASQLALFGGAFQPTDAGGIINRTYEVLQEGERALNTYKKLLDDGEVEKAEAYLDANFQRMERGSYYESFKRAMKQVTDEMNMIRKSEDLPKEKRERLDQLRLEQIGIAKEYRALIRQAE